MKDSSNKKEDILDKFEQEINIKYALKTENNDIAIFSNMNCLAAVAKIFLFNQKIKPGLILQFNESPSVKSF